MGMLMLMLMLTLTLTPMLTPMLMLMLMLACSSRVGELVGTCSTRTVQHAHSAAARDGMHRAHTERTLGSAGHTHCARV